MRLCPVSTKQSCAACILSGEERPFRDFSALQPPFPRDVSGGCLGRKRSQHFNPSSSFPKSNQTKEVVKKLSLPKRCGFALCRRSNLVLSASSQERKRLRDFSAPQPLLPSDVSRSSVWRSSGSQEYRPAIEV
ncbi:hypothetical protein CEXT_27021 [Caerostris extrusa]|uniref:Uncharacterized protein n=1 Tax=Caerostris extrusa TaxID=172846 RepID=A0AAV4XEH6_CAEEX|nr:hypothetical protein CEXT_27021 [Caerostris extrusa]